MYYKMVRYDCPRCGYTTDRKGNIDRHIDSKKLCEPLLSEVNPNDFRSIILREDNTNDIIKRLMDDSNNISQTVSKTVSNSENIKSVSNSIDNSINNSTINMNTHNTNNITITLTSCDEPELNYITEEDANKCLKSLKTSMLEMAKKIYFNPNHPENHNVYKTNMKNKIIKYFKDNKWNVGDQDVVINTMVENIRDALENGEKDMVDDLSHKYDNDEDFKNRIDRSLLIECYNNKPKGQLLSGSLNNLGSS